jgi:hypothetical protein
VTAAAVESSASRVAGTYLTFDHSSGEMSAIRDLMPMLQQRVRAHEDGSIAWQGRRWVEIERLVFQADDAPDVIVFRENDSGDVRELHSWTATYGRIPWRLTTPVQLTIAGTCVVVFASWALGGAIRALRREAAKNLNDQRRRTIR